MKKLIKRNINAILACVCLISMALCWYYFYPSSDRGMVIMAVVTVSVFFAFSYLIIKQVTYDDDRLWKDELNIKD
jgi:membrane protein YdbS with pleckstrin-like domain